MLYQITVKVEAEATYQRPYKIEVDNFIIEVIVNSGKIVEALSIALRVNNYQDFLPQVSLDIESRITHRTNCTNTW